MLDITDRDTFLLLEERLDTEDDDDEATDLSERQMSVLIVARGTG